jgi:hypothetical protein
MILRLQQTRSIAPLLRASIFVFSCGGSSCFGGSVGGAPAANLMSPNPMVVFSPPLTTPAPPSATVPTGVNFPTGAGVMVVQSESGKSLYVNPTGSDAGGGTATDPFATLNHALGVAQAGDTIIIDKGDYAWPGGVSLSKSGTADNWLVVRAATDANGQMQPVTIHGPGLSPAATDCIDVNAAYVDIEGIGCDGFPHVGIAVTSGHHIRLHGNRVANVGSTGIANYYVPSMGSMAYQVEISNNTVANTNLLWANSSAWGWGQGITGWGNQVTVANNTVSFTNGEGIGAAGIGAWITGNIVLNSCTVGVYIETASGVLMEKNFIRNDGAGQATFFGTCVRQASNGNQPLYGVGIQTASEHNGTWYTGVDYARLTNVVIRNNIVSNMRIAFKYATYNLGDPLHSWRVSNNTFVGGTASLLVVPTSPTTPNTDVVFANNIFLWPGATNPRAVSVGGSGLTFLNNLWSGTAAAGAASATDVNADPKLNNAASDQPVDYSPKSGSPASGAASAAYLPADDYFGNSRAAKPPGDIGAILVR